MGEDRPRRLGLRRSGPAVPHHHQRLAHLPGGRRRSAPPTRARNTCSWTTPPATWPRSTCSPSTTADEQVRRRRLRHACRLWTMVLEISVLMAQFPSQGDRRAVLRLPHPGPRLRQHRRPADDHGHPLRREGRPRAVRRADRDHDRRQPTPPRPKWRRSSAPSPATSSNAAPHAARDPQPPPRRPRRTPRLRRPRASPRCRSITPPAADQTLVEPRASSPGTRRWSSANCTATATRRPP